MINFQDTEVAFQPHSLSDLRRSHFIFKFLNFPLLVKWGASLARVALFLHLPIRAIIRATIFKQFCGGETLHESFERAEKMAKYGVHTILDVAVEGSQTEITFDRTMEEILETIYLAKNRTFLPFSVFKVTGIARTALLEKVQTDATLTTEQNEEWQRVRSRVLRLCQTAFDCNVRFLIDAEESWIQDAIDNLAVEMMERFNTKEAVIFNTFQMYRKDRLDHLKNHIRRAMEKKYYLGAKIVRGAYLEKECVRAERLKLASPLFETKPETDASYDQAIRLCVENLSSLSIVAGTHNEYSTQLLVELLARLKISKNDKRVYFSQLFGMSDNLSYNLAREGYLVAKFLPFGEVRVLLPYLIRRAQENTAVHGQTPRELEMLRREIYRRSQNKVVIEERRS